MTHIVEFRADRFKDVFTKLSSNVDLKLILSGVSFIGEFIFKAHTEALLVVFLLVILDTLTGVIKSIKHKNLESRGFFRFAVKLVVYSILMAVASLVDKALPVAVAMPVMYTFLAATEGISILENVSQAGYPVPTKIVESLKIMKQDTQKSE
ncbi:MAG: hypothetical protein RLZZ181_124 [Pseudomonadota bacterium]|jgi:toxin secretion/phage lysis holin